MHPGEDDSDHVNGNGREHLGSVTYSGFNLRERLAAVELKAPEFRLLPPLLFASFVCAAMLIARWAWCGTPRYSCFLFNLFLAWIPLGFTFAIHTLRSAEIPRQRAIWACAVAWFLFFPNAPYIVTDMVHLGGFTKIDGVPKWFDIMVIMGHAVTGLFLGCASLWAMETLVAERLGRRMGWIFSVGMLALASFGIYLGRFLRLNSWDVVFRPDRIVERMWGLTHPVKAFEVFAFSVTFFLFSVGVYWFIASTARLAPARVDLRDRRS